MLTIRAGRLARPWPAQQPPSPAVQPQPPVESHYPASGFRGRQQSGHCQRIPASAVRPRERLAALPCTSQSAARHLMAQPADGPLRTGRSGTKPHACLPLRAPRISGRCLPPSKIVTIRRWRCSAPRARDPPFGAANVDLAMPPATVPIAVICADVPQLGTFWLAGWSSSE